MLTLYFTDTAYGNIDHLSRDGRRMINDLYDQLCLLEKGGIPEDARRISNLVDVDGEEMEGYLASMGKFALVMTVEGNDELIIWEILIRTTDD